MCLNYSNTGIRIYHYNSFNCFYPNKSSSNISEITQIKLDKKIQDLGIIRSQNNYKFDFKITNIGKFPLNIRKVDVSCSCMTVHVSSKKISPHKSGKINVILSAKKIDKQFQKSIVIVANTNPEITLLTIKGSAVTKSY